MRSSSRGRGRLLLGHKHRKIKQLQTLLDEHKRSGFVSGHGFSRAAKSQKSGGLSAPAGRIFPEMPDGIVDSSDDAWQLRDHFVG
jgi:hypothetical protein